MRRHDSDQEIPHTDCRICGRPVYYLKRGPRSGLTPAEVFPKTEREKNRDAFLANVFGALTKNNERRISKKEKKVDVELAIRAPVPDTLRPIYRNTARRENRGVVELLSGRIYTCHYCRNEIEERWAFRTGQGKRHSKYYHPLCAIKAGFDAKVPTPSKQEVQVATW